MAGLTSMPPQPRVNKMQRMTNAAFAKAGQPIPGSPQAQQGMPPQGQAPMQRVSPGVYRNAQGGLQQGNQQAPQPQQRPQMPPQGQNPYQPMSPMQGGLRGGGYGMPPMQPGQNIDPGFSMQGNGYFQGQPFGQNGGYGMGSAMQNAYNSYGGQSLMQQQGGGGFANFNPQQQQQMGQMAGQYLKGRF